MDLSNRWKALIQLLLIITSTYGQPERSTTQLTNLNDDSPSSITPSSSTIEDVQNSSEPFEPEEMQTEPNDVDGDDDDDDNNNNDPADQPDPTKSENSTSYPSCKTTYFECWTKELCPMVSDIIETCNSSFADEEVIKKCTNFQKGDFIEDNSLFAPITHAEKNITYLNVYCGICNFEKELYGFRFWTPWLSCTMLLNESSSIDHNSTSGVGGVANSIKNADPIDGSRMMEGLISIEDGSRLISVLNESTNATYDCSVLRVVPKGWENRIPQCFYLNSNMFSQSETVVLTIRRKLYRHFHSNSSNFSNELQSNKYCSPSVSEDAVESFEMESLCEYRNQYGELCSINSFLNRSSIKSKCNSNGYILFESSKGLEWSECSNHTSKPDTIYVCGPTEAKLRDKIKKTILKIFDNLSTFLLFAYLVMSTNRLNLRSLPKRIFYSYALSLLAVYLCDFFLKYIQSCAIKYCVFFYIWQSYSFWILITSFDLWRIVYSSLKLKKVSIEGQSLRYAGYCLLAWGLPVVFLVVLLPTIKDTQISWSCPIVHGFRNELTCSSSCELNEYTFHFGWITVAIFLVLAPCLLTLTCYFVCMSRRNRARSSVNRTYTTALIKVAIMMGLHWMLLTYLTLFISSVKLDVVYEFISSFHGTFIFFAFGLENSTLNAFKKSIGLGVDAQQIQSTTLVSQTNQEAKLSPTTKTLSSSEKPLPVSNAVGAQKKE